MAWIYLILAGLCETGWPLGLKIAQGTGHRIAGASLAVVCIAVSGLLLWLAQREIPIGTSYAVWTGIGATGTFLVGVAFFEDAASLARFLGVALIVAGVVTLRLAN